MNKEIRKYKRDLLRWRLQMIKYNYHYNMSELQCDIKASWYGMKKIGLKRTLQGEHYYGEFPEGFFDKIWERHF